jgi:hypothetical protein
LLCLAVDGAEAGARAAASDGTDPSWLLPLACEAPAADEPDQGGRRDVARGNTTGERGEGEAGSGGHPSFSDMGSPHGVCAAASKGSPERGEEGEGGEEGEERRIGGWWRGKQVPIITPIRTAMSCETAWGLRGGWTEPWTRICDGGMAKKAASGLPALIAAVRIDRASKQWIRAANLSASPYRMFAQGMSRQRQGEGERRRMGVAAPERRKGSDRIYRR